MAFICLWPGSIRQVVLPLKLPPADGSAAALPILEASLVYQPTGTAGAVAREETKLDLRAAASLPPSVWAREAVVWMANASTVNQLVPSSHVGWWFNRKRTMASAHLKCFRQWL